MIKNKALVTLSNLVVPAITKEMLDQIPRGSDLGCEKHDNDTYKKLYDAFEEKKDDLQAREKAGEDIGMQLTFHICQNYPHKQKYIADKYIHLFQYEVVGFIPMYNFAIWVNDEGDIIKVDEISDEVRETKPKIYVIEQVK